MAIHVDSGALSLFHIRKLFQVVILAKMFSDPMYVDPLLIHP